MFICVLAFRGFGGKLVDVHSLKPTFCLFVVHLQDASITTGEFCLCPALVEGVEGVSGDLG